MPVKIKKEKILVSIIMGSDSDLPIMKEARDILKQFNIGSEIKILSAHRSPHEVADFASSAIKRGIKTIIAGAGGAAHLPGVTAAFTTLPVIGVPIKAKSLEGLDSLLSIVQMPSGVPVATVGINMAKNAGILAAQIIACSDINLTRKMLEFKKQLNRESLNKNKNIEKHL